jgi:hypothetical protein
MLRWLLLGLLLYGLGTALRKGWIEVQWQRLLEDAGLMDTGSDKPLPLHELPMLKAPPPVQDSSR